MEKYRLLEIAVAYLNNSYGYSLDDALDAIMRIDGVDRQTAAQTLGQACHDAERGDENGWKSPPPHPS